MNKLVRLLTVATCLFFQTLCLPAFAQTTAFTYQGRLNTSGNPANGKYDFTFALFPVNSGGSPVNGTVTLTNSAVGVTNGLFTTTLDFGNPAYNGQSLWVEVTVSTNGANSFTTLSPRQALTSTPYAVQALNASSATVANSVSATNINGTLLNTTLPANPVFSGPVNAQSFAGDGSALTNLNFRLNDSTMFFRGGTDTNHGLGWFGSSKTFGTINVDGPALFGFSGGVLGIGQYSNRYPVLSWNASGNVGIGTANPATTLDVNGSINSSTVNAALYKNLSVSSLVNTTNPTVVAWGLGSIIRTNNNLDYGQAIVPSEFTSPTAQVQSVAAGLRHSLALRNNGTVAAWGDNTRSQSSVPSGLNSVTAIVAGDFHSLALKSNGTVAAWGANDTLQSTVPSALTNAVAISAGYGFSMALKNDGTVLVWGDNTYGQTNVPPTLAQVKAISAGATFCVALKSNGTVVAWGDNSLQQTNTSSLSGIQAIAAGADGGIGLLPNGHVTIWGWTESNLRNVSPFATNITAIACGQDHGIGLRADGSLVIWGYVDIIPGDTFMPSDLKPVISLGNGTCAQHFIVIQQNPSPIPLLNGDNTFNGNIQVNGTVSGNGTGLTNLDATQLTGSIPSASLPSDVALTDTNQTFTSSNSFTADTGLTGNAYFGNTERQMLNLFNASYGMGVQNTTEYFRTGPPGGFAWFAGGVHTNNQNDPGPGGTLLMKLGNAGFLTATGFVGDGSKLTNLDATQLINTIPLAQLPSQLVTNNETGVTLSGTFNGNGSGLTNLNATNLTSTIPLARLPSQVVTNTATGITLGGIFSGNGNGLTNLNASQLSSGLISTSVLSGFQSPYITISGGAGNAVSGSYASIGGGQSNNISNSGSTIAGGQKNTNMALAGYIGGGQNNYASNVLQPVISGGYGNFVSGSYSTISGGINNNALGSWAVIGGGNGNNTTGDDSVISGGINHSNMAQYGTISGGNNNNVAAKAGTISGGVFNTITNAAPTTSGWAVISGGANNVAGGIYATIPGGSQNYATADYTFAAGNSAQATNTGAFVWSDGTGTATGSASNNSVTFRASGGYRIYTTTGSTAGMQLAAGGSSWITVSDRTAKKNFQPIDSVAVLNKLAAMPLSQWNYKWENDNDVPNIGPMAQDFKAAFYPGRDDKGISTLEFDGVELAAIQGLNRKLEKTVQQKDAEIKALQERLDRLEKLLPIPRSDAGK